MQIVNSLFGTLSVSTVPSGVSITYMLDGNALFNHTRIYDDKQTIDYVGDLLAPYLQNGADASGS